MTKGARSIVFTLLKTDVARLLVAWCLRGRILMEGRMNAVYESMVEEENRNEIAPILVPFRSIKLFDSHAGDFLAM
jgi:hypothetical protein